MALTPFIYMNGGHINGIYDVQTIIEYSGGIREDSKMLVI